VFVCLPSYVRVCLTVRVCSSVCMCICHVDYQLARQNNESEITTSVQQNNTSRSTEYTHTHSQTLLRANNSHKRTTPILTSDHTVTSWIQDTKPLRLTSVEPATQTGRTLNVTYDKHRAEEQRQDRKQQRQSGIQKVRVLR